MSWLFGLNNKGAIGDAPQVPVLGGDDGVTASEEGGSAAAPLETGSSGDTGYRSESYSFDSSALERAAKAAKVRRFLCMLDLNPFCIYLDKKFARLFSFSHLCV